MYEWVYGLWVPSEAHKRTSDALELKLQVVLSSLPWILGTELGSFERAASTHNC